MANPKALRPVLQRPGGLVGMTPQRPVRTDAQPVTPGAPPQPTNIDRTSDTYTYITDGAGRTKVLYNGDRLWSRVVLTLETAGPVVVGTREDIVPVLSGKGRLLVTNLPTEFTIAKTSRLYIASTALNRVSVTIEPLPWLEQIANACELIKQK